MFKIIILCINVKELFGLYQLGAGYYQTTNKIMNLISRATCFFFLLLFSDIINEKVTYLSLEHPTLSYYLPKYISYANFSAKRRGRSNPVYYVSMNFYATIWFGNNISFDFFFLEFLSNRYKPSFVEMRFKFCNLIHKDFFFGPAFRQGKLDGPCPYPPGEYNLNNMTVNPTVIPRSFPFRKGRIYANVSLLTTGELLAYGHIDMELKELHRKKGEKL